jgi:hypothetical protein
MAVIEMDIFWPKGSDAKGGVMQLAPRLRMANIRLQQKSFVIGHDWSVFALLNQTSMVHASIFKFSSSGNLWNGFPHLLAEYKFKIDERTSLLMQEAFFSALGEEITPAINQADDLSAGELSLFPLLELRMAADISPSSIVGASFHYG